jgi:hypothetical protein
MMGLENLDKILQVSRTEIGSEKIKELITNSIKLSPSQKEVLLIPSVVFPS